MAGVLTGCGDSEAPTTDSKVPTDEPQEPMDTGPMSNDGQATRESTGLDLLLAIFQTPIKSAAGDA